MISTFSWNVAPMVAGRARMGKRNEILDLSGPAGSRRGRVSHVTNGMIKPVAGMSSLQADPFLHLGSCGLRPERKRTRAQPASSAARRRAVLPRRMAEIMRENAVHCLLAHRGARGAAPAAATQQPSMASVVD